MNTNETKWDEGKWICMDGLAVVAEHSALDDLCRECVKQADFAIHKMLGHVIAHRVPDLPPIPKYWPNAKFWPFKD